MRDYAEVVNNLRCCNKDAACDGCTYFHDEEKCCGIDKEAADAIEELLAERDKALKRLCEWCGVCSEENRKALECDDIAMLDAPRWISVEDEPPKENGRYLVRYKRDVNLGDEETVREDEIRIMRFFVGDGWRYPIICNDYVRLVNEEVTHWMPLPEPPKEETE